MRIQRDVDSLSVMMGNLNELRLKGLFCDHKIICVDTAGRGSSEVQVPCHFLVLQSNSTIYQSVYAAAYPVTSVSSSSYVVGRLVQLLYGEVIEIGNGEEEAFWKAAMELGSESDDKTTDTGHIVVKTEVAERLVDTGDQLDPDEASASPIELNYGDVLGLEDYVLRSGVDSDWQDGLDVLGIQLPSQVVRKSLVKFREEVSTLCLEKSENGERGNVEIFSRLASMPFPRTITDVFSNCNWSSSRESTPDTPTNQETLDVKFEPPSKGEDNSSANSQSTSSGFRCLACGFKTRKKPVIMAHIRAMHPDVVTLISVAGGKITLLFSVCNVDSDASPPLRPPPHVEALVAFASDPVIDKEACPDPQLPFKTLPLQIQTGPPPKRRRKGDPEPSTSGLPTMFPVVQNHKKEADPDWSERISKVAHSRGFKGLYSLEKKAITSTTTKPQPQRGFSCDNCGLAVKDAKVFATHNCAEVMRARAVQESEKARLARSSNENPGESEASTLEDGLSDISDNKEDSRLKPRFSCPFIDCHYWTNKKPHMEKHVWFRHKKVVGDIGNAPPPPPLTRKPSTTPESPADFIKSLNSLVCGDSKTPTSAPPPCKPSKGPPSKTPASGPPPFKSPSTNPSKESSSRSSSHRLLTISKSSSTTPHQSETESELTPPNSEGGPLDPADFIRSLNSLVCGGDSKPSVDFPLGNLPPGPQSPDQIVKTEPFESRLFAKKSLSDALFD